MAPGSAVLFAMLIAAALLPIVIVLQLTKLAHSKFRDELWTIRDGLADDIRTGRIERSRGSRRLLELVESHIAIADRHTLIDSLLVAAIYESDQAPSIYDDVLGADVPPDDRGELSRYLGELVDASVKHLKWSSPAGWVAIPLLRVMRGISGLLRSSRGSPTVHERVVSQPRLHKKVERVEVELIPRAVRSHRTSWNRAKVPDSLAGSGSRAHP